MKITGIAHAPQRLMERTNLPSGDMVFLAKRALRLYKVTYLFTSLTPGWEQALVKAALELGIPYTVAIPYPDYDIAWDRPVRISASGLMARAASIQQVSACEGREALMETHCWRVDRSDLLLALWNYDFYGETYDIMNYAMKCNRQVVNLWQDWEHMAKMRRQVSRDDWDVHRRGAQVYESKQ